MIKQCSSTKNGFRCARMSHHTGRHRFSCDVGLDTLGDDEGCVYCDDWTDAEADGATYDKAAS